MELLKTTNQREQATLKKLEEEIGARKTAIQTKHPFWNWADFLEHKACAGDETSRLYLDSNTKNIVLFRIFLDA